MTQMGEDSATQSNTPTQRLTGVNEHFTWLNNRTVTQSRTP